MNILKWELKSNLKSLILFTLGAVALLLLGMFKFSAMTGSESSLSTMLDMIPKPFLVAFGMIDIDITVPIGFYGVNFMFILLIAAFHGASIGTDIIVKEENEHTAEFLYVKPIKRNRIITMKLIAGLINIIIFNIALFITSIIALISYEYSLNKIVYMFIGLFFVQALFLIIGMTIGIVSNNPKKASNKSMAIIGLMYLLYVLSDMSDSLSMLKYLTPFKFFGAGYVINNGLAFISIGVVSVIICIGLYLIYNHNKRDLKI